MLTFFLFTVVLPEENESYNAILAKSRPGLGRGVVFRGLHSIFESGITGVLGVTWNVKSVVFWIERQLSSNYNIDQLVPYSTSTELACEHHISSEMQKQKTKKAQPDTPRYA